MSTNNGYPRLQPIITSGVSQRTLKVKVVLPERKERFRVVTEIGTKEVLDYLKVTGAVHGKLLESPGKINNRDGEATGTWAFEKKDLRVNHKTTKPKSKK